MPFAVVVGLFVLGCWICKLRTLLGAVTAPLAWSREDFVDQPTAIVREAATALLGVGERTTVAPNATVDIYTRGDARIRRVLFAWQVRLGQVSSYLSIGVASVNGRTLVTLRVDVLPNVLVSRFAADRLGEQAQSALLGLLIEVKRCAAEIAEAQRRQAAGPHQPRRSSLDADFAMLGLKPGASAEQVQAAFRDACRKYHPDRLTGQNVAPHLVDLATQRFTEVTASYHRLRDHLAAPSAA